MAYELITNNAQTTLSAGINNSVTSLSVASATLFPTTGNFRIRIGTELLLVTAVSGTTFTVTRGIENTTAASHSSGDDVTLIVTAASMGNLTSERFLHNTYANLPGSSDPPRLFIPSDSIIQHVNQGGTLYPYCLGMPVVLPVDGNFSWVNQGSATVDTSKGGIYIENPNLDSADTFRMKVKSIPSAPYTCTIGFIINRQPRATYTNCALILRKNSTGEFVTFYDIDFSTSAFGTNRQIRVQRWNSPTSFNSQQSINYVQGAMPISWLRVVDDNTDRKFYVSYDGVHFLLVFSETRTNFITPDEIGFGIANVLSGGVTGANGGAWLVHYKDN